MSRPLTVKGYQSEENFFQLVDLHRRKRRRKKKECRSFSQVDESCSSPVVRFGRAKQLATMM